MSKCLLHSVKIIFLFSAVLLLCCRSFAQNDTTALKTDTTALKADTTTAKKNIQANLKTVDNTAPAVYNINPWSTAIIGVAATAANMVAINNVLHNKRDLTPVEVQALRPDVLNGFDHWALELDPSKRDHFYSLSDKSLTVVLAASAATFILGKKTRKDWLRLALMYYQTQFLTFAFYDFSPFGPLFQNRLRPYVYYDYFPYDDRKGGNQRNSMYSGHVANATAATFFAVKVYLDYHPEMRSKKVLLYGLASLPPLFVGYTRIKALAHFPSDVLMGYLIGGVFGIVVPELHRIKSSNLKLNTYYNGQTGGVQMTYHFGKQKKGLLME